MLTNCVTYGSLAGLAEFSQQTIQTKVIPTLRGERKSEYNFPAIARYTALGSTVFSPVLYFWYKWLDKTFPGKVGKTVLIKVLLDVSVLAIPLYSLFYAVLNLLEGRSVDYTLQELRDKLLLTLTLAVLFWVPAQAINFRFLPPTARVIYVAACTFVEINLLAVLKKMDLSK